MAFQVATRKRKVQPAAAPAAGVSVQTSAADFGGIEAGLLRDVGRGAQRVGQIALQREESEERERITLEAEQEKKRLKYQEKIDGLRANEAVVKFQDELRGLRSVHRSNTGSNAIGLLNVALKDVEKMQKSFSDGLKNDRQKELYGARAASDRELYLNQTSIFETNETNRAEQENIDARIDNAIIDAANFADDPLARFSKRLDLDIALIDKTEGMDTDQAKNVKASAVSAYHEGILNQLVMADAPLAKEYYDQKKDEILPDQREAVEKVLESEDVLQQSQLLSDQIVVEEEDRTKWRGMAEKAAKGDVRKETISILNSKKKSLDQNDKEGQRDTLLNGYKEINLAQSHDEGLAIVNRQTDPDNFIKLEKYNDAKFDLKTKNPETTPDGLNLKYKMISAVDSDPSITEEEIIITLAGSGIVGLRDIEEVIKHKKDGGITKDLGEAKLRRLYNGLTTGEFKTTIEDEDRQKNYMAVRQFVVDYTKATGETPLDDKIIEIMTKALVSTPSKGIIFKTPGLTLAEASRTGRMGEFIAGVEVPEEKGVPFNKTDIIDRLQLENERREKSGLPALTIDAQAVKEYYLINKAGLKRVSGSQAQIPTPTAPTQVPVAPSFVPEQAIPAAPAEVITPPGTLASIEAIIGRQRQAGNEISISEASEIQRTLAREMGFEIPEVRLETIVERQKELGRDFSVGEASKIKRIIEQQREIGVTMSIDDAIEARRIIVEELGEELRPAEDIQTEEEREEEEITERRKAAFIKQAAEREKREKKGE